MAGTRLFCVCALAAAAASWGKQLVVHRHRASAVPAPPVVEEAQVGRRKDWVQVRPASGEEAHNVTFCIRQRHLHKLHEALMEVSDPASAKRGQYLTYEEAHKLTANPEATDRVLGWLRDESVEVLRVEAHGQYIRARASVSAWERLLWTRFAHLAPASAAWQKLVLRAIEDVHLPDGMEEYIAGTFGTTQLPPLRLQAAEAAGVEPGDGARPIVPEMLRQYYEMAGAGSASQSQAVVEVGAVAVSLQDLADFQRRVANMSRPIPIAHDINGYMVEWNDELGRKASGEANLDTQYIQAIAPATPLTYWVVDDWESLVESAAAMPEPPKVISISYGQLEQELGNSTMQQFNIEAMRLGLQGVTILVSSGDNGALVGVKDPSECAYGVSFPASSPFVTAVGATQGGAQGGPEVACERGIVTGGGFSGLFPAQPWQAGAISHYFSVVSPEPLPGYALGGRGLPDVAMAGFNYEVVVNGSLVFMDGTSASAPVFAGMVSLVNSAQEAGGRPTVGFLNPTLYAAGPASFHDITSGHNNCTKGTEERRTCCAQGFSAAAGWDPLTGRGSVHLPQLLAMFSDPGAV